MRFEHYDFPLHAITFEWFRFFGTEKKSRPEKPFVVGLLGWTMRRIEFGFLGIEYSVPKTQFCYSDYMKNKKSETFLLTMFMKLYVLLH